jgi:hypothetical protein
MTPQEHVRGGPLDESNCVLPRSKELERTLHNTCRHLKFNSAFGEIWGTH